MIRVTIKDRGRLITGFKIKGHANAGAYGNDIVCAAVSVLSITTVNSLIAIAGVHPQVHEDKVNGGLLIVNLPQITDSKVNLKVQTLLKSLELGIRNISKSYSTHVNLKIINSNTEV